MRPVALAGILASTTILSGCAGTIAGVSLSSLSSVAGFASTLFTGADLGEHAVSLVTGKDCRFSEGLMRADRSICEEPGSLATRDDFHGIFIDRIETDGTVVYAAPKYLPASIGAGENENNPDVIWAEIKKVKAAEENERQLARANSAQQIDVAALATETVSSQSLAFLPASTTTDLIDGDTASQTAKRPREVVNAAAPSTAKPATDSVGHVSAEADQPAIDATTFAAATGEGGPLIPTSIGSTPVSSKLINGEPVVILRLRPIMSSSTTAQMQTAAAIQDTMPFEDTPAPTKIASRPSNSVRSPQAILSDVPARTTYPSTPTRVAEVTPAAPPAAKPRTKPASAELLTAAAKPANSAPAVALPATRKPADAHKPSGLAPEDAAYAGPTPVQAPSDVPAEPAAQPALSDAPAAAEPAPSPLIPMQQE